MSAILSTLAFPRPEWAARVDIVAPRERSLPRRALELMRRADSYDAVIFNGAERSDQILAGLLALRRKRPVIVITDCTWKREGSPRERSLNAVGARILNRAGVHCCVLSHYELESLPRNWGIAPERVHLTPFCHTLSGIEMADPPDGAGAFAGGESLRDYDPLIEAAANLGVPLRIASADRRVLRSLPPQVLPVPVSHERIVKAMREAAVVVVPMQAGIDRSAGATYFLNAMALGKFVIATRSPATGDYLRDGETGLIVEPGDVGAIEAALLRATDKKNKREQKRIRAAARETALERFSPDNYVAAVLAVVDHALKVGRGGDDRDPLT